MREFRITDAKGGAAFPVRVVTRASKNEIVGMMDDGAIKIRVTAPPTEGRANKVLIEFLADFFDVRKDQIEIVAGHSSREKIISVIGITPDEVDALLPLSTKAEE